MIVMLKNNINELMFTDALTLFLADYTCCVSS